MLSIGIFTYSTKPRGSVVHAACLAEALSARGHAVTLYALSKDGDGFFRDVTCPLRLMRAGAAPSDIESLVRQRVAEVKRGLATLKARHDVFHAEDCLVGSALIDSAELGVENVVRTVHHVEHFENPYLAACQRRSIAQADALFCVSAFTQREVEGEFGRRSSLVKNGVDCARFARRALGRESRCCARFGVQSNETLLLSVGGVEERKNTLLMLEAVLRVLAKHANARWLIAGGASIFDHSDYLEGFEARLRAAPASVASRIVRTGVLAEAELVELYARSDVLLCASKKEGFGLCVLEALAADTAVIASSQPPFDEYLDAGCACLVDPSSVEAIVGALSRLLEDRSYARTLRQNGKRRAERFSWLDSADEHARLYRASLGARSHEPSANA